MRTIKTYSHSGAMLVCEQLSAQGWVTQIVRERGLWLVQAQEVLA